ncbi:MAG: GGDEF domain-containing protein [Lachnospiraceae bacterium]|nr:GGDEF domain-containing protein [Lachnospiraceae bacterium]
MEDGREKASPGMIPAYRRASDRDVMLDMLSKRAILDYAHRVCKLPDCPTTYFVVFDLDNFKIVNDSFGHMFGDEVLHTVTKIINQAIGANGMVGRLGGDEILIVTKGVQDKMELRPFLREIRVNVEEEFKDKLDGISLTCSMGAAAYPEHADSSDKAMELADKMLYLAKEKGRNRYIIYTPEMHADILNNAGDAKGIKNAFVKTFDKVQLIQYFCDDYLLKGTSSNENSFRNVGEAFHLQEVLIVYGKGKVGFRWTEDKRGCRDEDLRWMALDGDFYSYFNTDSLFIIDGLYDLGGDKEGIKKKLVERGIESALFYRLQFLGDPQGYAMFAKKGQRQKWSEYEILALATIAKVFEISLQIGEKRMALS